MSPSTQVLEVRLRKQWSVPGHFADMSTCQNQLADTISYLYVVYWGQQVDMASKWFVTGQLQHWISQVHEQNSKNVGVGWHRLHNSEKKEKRKE